MTVRAFATVLALAIAVAARGGEGRTVTYPISNQGTLALQIPDGWTARPEGLGTGLPPTLKFTEASTGTTLLITPLWSLRKDPSFASPERLRKLAEHAAGAVQPTAREPKLEVVELKGAGGAGYYFTATDKAPKPGEHEYLAQGVAPAGSLVLSFTVLSHRRPPAGFTAALEIVSSAKHAKK